MSIYVEIRVRGSMDALWRHTQQPELHERWDLRFSEIVYRPRPDETAPQQFGYTTRIGFGLRIHGEGQSEGSRASGAFDVEWREVPPGSTPAHLRPAREERRE